MLADNPEPRASTEQAAVMAVVHNRNSSVPVEAHGRELKNSRAVREDAQLVLTDVVEQCRCAVCGDPTIRREYLDIRWNRLRDPAPGNEIFRCVVDLWRVVSRELRWCAIGSFVEQVKRDGNSGVLQQDRRLQVALHFVEERFVYSRWLRLRRWAPRAGAGKEQKKRDSLGHQ